MSALRTCPGCGDRRILLPAARGRLCVDCRDHPQGRLFTREATLDDLGAERADVLAERHHDDAGIPAPRCSCARPLGDGDGGCLRCGRWAAA
jgi:hypothetical protein